MMYNVMLFHDGKYNACAKSEVYPAFSDALSYLTKKLHHGEYESALVYHGSTLILAYVRDGLDL